MTHTQLTIQEAALIHRYLHSGLSVMQVSVITHQSRPTIYRINQWVDTGKIFLNGSNTLVSLEVFEEDIACVWLLGLCAHSSVSVIWV